MFFHLNQKNKIFIRSKSTKDNSLVCRVRQVKNSPSPIRSIQCLSDPHCSKSTVGIVLKVTNAKSNEAAMAERLCCLARTIKVVGPNLGASRHRMNMANSLKAVSDHSDEVY